MLDYIYLFINKINSNFNENVIEGKKNRKKKKKKKKKKAQAAAAVSSGGKGPAAAAAATYANSKGLTIESTLIGPEYRYSDYIKPPRSLGMSSRGNMDALEKDVNGLFAYVDLLIKGKSKAVRGNEILGPQSFVPTGATCQLDVGGGKETTVQRYLYNNFKPTGNTPVDGGDGYVKDARGLIPGLMENAAKLNPLDMFESFLDTNPKCMMLKMPVTIPGKGVVQQEKPVSMVDIAQMDPCSFPYYGYRNFVSNAVCNRQGFENIYDKTENFYDKTYIEIDDIFDTHELYSLTMSCVALYIILKAININIDE